jgi:tetratricopeptide (TPR) repeat protein
MKILYFSLLLAIALLLINPLSARADIAPPDQPSGANPLPGNEPTLVRMLAEEVLIDVLRNTPQSSLGQARVTANFTMQNLGREAETMAVRFPLTFFGQVSGDQDASSEIKEVKVRVDGRQVATRRVDYGWLDYPNSPWIEFEVTFPPGETLPIEVTYLQEGVGEYPYISFDYTLETGAGWDGTIGSADLIVRLPYDANSQNVIFDEQIGWAMTTPGGILDGREVRWHYEDLNPDYEHNLQVALVMPQVWRRVLDEQERIANNPEDGEAWGRLGKLYKEASRLRKGNRSDAGGQELHQMSVQAYEKAVDLRPNDAAWHAGFADLLWGHYYYEQYFLDQPDHGEMLRALQELDRALAIDPRQARAQEILLDISFAVPEAVARQEEGFTISWLTATPTNRPSATPETVEPTQLAPSITPAPSATATSVPVTPTVLRETPTQPQTSPAQVTLTPPENIPQAGRGGGLCGGAALLPLGVIVWASRRKGRYSK